VYIPAPVPAVVQTPPAHPSPVTVIQDGTTIVPAHSTAIPTWPSTVTVIPAPVPARVQVAPAHPTPITIIPAPIPAVVQVPPSHPSPVTVIQDGTTIIPG
jgi:hypothetical protein